MLTAAWPSVHAAQLARGEEAELRVVVGDLCPLPRTLGLLRQFFDRVPGTQLHLYFEALAGPAERLLEGEADLMLHHVDKTDPRFEYNNLFNVRVIPVAAPGYLKFPMTPDITPEQLRDYVQCVIRDSARVASTKSYYLIEGARQWTVSDQLMKRELILQGMGWGHLPDHLVADDLLAGRLVSIAGRHLAGGQVDIVASRLRDRPRGPIAVKLWEFIGAQSG